MANTEQQGCEGIKTTRRSSKEKLGDISIELANVFTGNEKAVKKS